MLLAAVVLTLAAVGNWMLLHPQARTTDVSTSGRYTGALVTVHTYLPEKYNRPLMIFAWDVPMGIFALWLIFGGRNRGKAD